MSVCRLLMVFIVALTVFSDPLRTFAAVYDDDDCCAETISLDMHVSPGAMLTEPPLPFVKTVNCRQPTFIGLVVREIEHPPQ